MVKTAFFFIAAFALKTGTAQGKIIVDLTNLKNNKGVCRACLFDTPQSFKGESGQPYACATIPAKNKTAQAVFENVATGNYALFVFHDENTNNKMDKNFLGIPSEGYGASKNKLPFASAPTFNDNKFVVGNKEEVRLYVKMRNL